MVSMMLMVTSLAIVSHKLLVIMSLLMMKLNFDDNVEDYYAFTNVYRSVEDAMQDSFLELDSSESQLKKGV